MKSLAELMKDRPWEQDWPIEIQASKASPEQWLNGVGQVPDSAELPAIAALLNGKPGHPTVKALREAIEDLDRWNEWASQFLTFPPTAQGMGKALVMGLTAAAGRDINERTQRVMHLYPDLSWSALEAVPDQVPQLDAALRQKWWPTPSPVARPSAPSPADPVPARPAAAPPRASNPAPTSTAGAAVPSPATASAPRPRTERPHGTEARWLRDQVLPLVRKDGNSTLIAQEVDAAIKRHFHSTMRPNWAEEILIPSLMALKANEMAELMPHWPSGARYEISNPIEFIQQPRFWAQMRDAEPDAQSRLVSDVLPRVIRSEDWTTEDRLRMLRLMLSFVRANRSSFEQRIELWENWGGKLEEKGVLESDRAADSEMDSFGTSQAPKSGLDWIRESELPMWKDWVQDHDRARAAKVEAAPEPAHERRRSRRPG